MKNKLFVLFRIFKFVCHDFELFFWNSRWSSIDLQKRWLALWSKKRCKKKDVLKNTQNKLKISKRRMILKSWNLKCSKDCSNDCTNICTIAQNYLLFNEFRIGNLYLRRPERVESLLKREINHTELCVCERPTSIRCSTYQSD